MADSGPDTDLDPLETQEWQDALSAVIEREGQERAHFLLETLIDQARRSGTHIPFRPTTAYLNTIPTAHEARSPGDPAIEWRVRSLIRWNALAMVMRADALVAILTRLGLDSDDTGRRPPLSQLEPKGCGVFIYNSGSLNICGLGCLCLKPT